MKKLFLLISNSRIFPCFYNKWKQRTWNKTDIICSWLMFLKKAVKLRPWDTRIAFAVKSGTHGTVECEPELTIHVWGFLQAAELDCCEVMCWTGSYDRKWTDASLAPTVNIQSLLDSIKEVYPRDHYILCFHLLSGPLVQSPEDTIKTREIQKGYVCRIHLHPQLSVFGDKRAAEKGI